MALTAIIAHHISRPAPNAAVKTELRADTLVSSGVLEEFIYTLKTTFIRKSGKSYGRFASETADFPISAWLQDYRTERLSFVSCTHKLMQQFVHEVEKSEMLCDSYVFFVVENIEAGQFIYIFLSEHMSSLYLDAKLELDSSRYLDGAGLNLAAKINLSDWEAGDSATYLTLLRSRGDKDMTDAFTRLLGFSDKHDIKNDTNEFLHVVDHYRETLDEQTARVARTKVVDYCLEQNKAGKPIVIAELSSTLAHELKTQEPEHFARFVAAQQTPPKAEFIADSAQIRNYVRISGRNDSLSMSFASECLGKEIVYDPQADVLTIKNIPSALKARLLKHLKSQ